jgi:uncharacterized protein involved in type VI secretion and phage assembly
MDIDVIGLLLDFVRSRYFGKYRGLVSDDTPDATHRGRVMVKVPAVLGDLEVWAMPCVPYAGKDVGFLSLPPKGAGVWVEFEGGDPSFPIWTGCFWADNEAPEQANPNLKLWKSGKHIVRLDDKAEDIQVTTSSNAKLSMKDYVRSEVGSSRHNVDANGVTADSGSLGKVEVAPTSVKVNGGALEVT